MKELRPGVADFQPARKALERLETTFRNLESTAAALLHPNLRKSSEKSLANRTPYRLSHPELKPTPGSQDVMTDTQPVRWRETTGMLTGEGRMKWYGEWRRQDGRCTARVTTLTRSSLYSFSLFLDGGVI
jgi:hypothetical protein